MAKEFKKLSLKRELIFEAVKGCGAVDCKENKGPPKFITGNLDGTTFRVNIYENADGTTTLGHSSGFDRSAFERVADHVAQHCALGSKARIEVSVKLSSGQVDELGEFLSDAKAVVTEKEEIASGYRLKWKGAQGDVLTINVYSNGTVQFQGRHLELASLVWDYLGNVLGLEDVLAKQIAAYSVPITVAEIKNELEGKIPLAYHKVSEDVRKQLSAALAWGKVRLELEDYSAVAFPALRALEGFLYGELASSGLSPKGDGFGEYFVSHRHGVWEMQPMPSNSVGQPKASLLSDVYGLYHTNRHGLFHMAAAGVGSRIIPTLEAANAIVSNVLRAIEKFYGHKK